MRAGVISGLFLLIALGFAAPAAAGQGDRPSLDRILPQIRAHTPGSFYDAEGPFMGADGQARYHIKWMMPDGRVVWFEADARTGRVLGAVPYGSMPYGTGPYGSGPYGGPHQGGNTNHFGNWPGYDRGNGGGWDRGRGGDWGHGGGDWGRGDHGRRGGGH
jgi:hypothetical protein